MDFGILGPLEVHSGGRPVAVGGPRERTALAMLLLEANHVVPVDRLIDAVWDDGPPATARGQIQICISSLRRRMTDEAGLDLIRTQNPGYVLRVDADQLDLHTFESGVAEGRAQLAGEPARAAAALRIALALWRGPALSGVDSRLVQPGAARLDERRLVVLGECLDAELQAGGHQEVIGELAQLVEQHPLRENFRALLMTALFRSGRQAEALESYRQSRQILTDELGIEPGDELRRLHQAILANDGTLNPVVRESVEVPTRAEPAASTRRPSLLPASIPDFTGRRRIVEKMLADIDAATTAGEAVAVSVIVGQGGAGKTTLAVHVAQLLSAQFPDGQLYARLRLGDLPVAPSDILERFLRALGVSGPALPDGVEERAELFRDLVGGRQLLIVLDDAMTEQQVSTLLPGNARCAVIVTSRRRLTGLPTVARIEIGRFPAHSAVALLSRVAGAARIEAEPEAVEQLCALCGHLPLALRIVAARLAARPHWGVADLVDRLVDESRRLDELHHGEMGVRASINLSYDALSPDAKVLFRRLALLESPSHAAWVAAPLLQGDIRHAQDVLEELTEAYLVDTEPGTGPGRTRYRLHDIMRPFARERLVEESAEDRRAALERWFGTLLALAGEAHRREYSGDFLQRASSASRLWLPDWLVDRLLVDPLGWFEAERVSLVSAVSQAAASGMVEHAWGLAHTAVTLFEAHSYFGDWSQTHDVALKAAIRASDVRGEATMRYSIGSLHLFEQRFDEATEQFEQALALFERLSDRHGLALVQRHMAHLARLSGDLHSALTQGQDALATFRAVGDSIGEAHVLQNLADVRLVYGDSDEAHRLLERAANICDQLDSRRVGAQVQHRLGELLLRRGDLDGAGAAYRRAWESVHESGDQVGECYAALGLASVELVRGNPAVAATSLHAALDVAVTTGERVVENRISLALAEAALAQHELPEATRHVDRAVKGFGSLGAELHRVRALLVLGRIRRAGGDSIGATAAWTEAQRALVLLKVDGPIGLAAELSHDLAELPGQDPNDWNLSA